MRTIIVIMAAAASSLSSHLPTDGFKQIKYGMTETELRTEGFTCTDGGSCSRDVSDSRYKSETLFGHPAVVDVSISDGRVVSVDVRIDIPASVLQLQLTKQFGTPKSFEYTSFTGNRRTQLVWRAKNGTSLSMVRAPQAEEPAIWKGHGSVRYNSEGATAKIMELAQKSSIRKTDY